MEIRRLATTITVICLLSLTGCRVDSGQSGSRVVSSSAACEKADNINWVAGNNLCLAIKTFVHDEKVSRPVLRVFLHGDNSRGGPSDYMYSYAPITTTSRAGGQLQRVMVVETGRLKKASMR